MKKLFLVFAMILSGLMPGMAKDFSVAYIDLQYILRNLPQYETANDQLTIISKRWQKEVSDLEQEARVLTANYETEQIFLSEAMRKQREQEILDKEQAAMELRRKYFGEDGELKKKREALLKPIQDDIYTAIQEIASIKGYQVVKDRSADPSLIYMSNQLDISDQVLNKLGAK